MRISVAFKAFFKALFDGQFAQKLADLLSGKEPEMLLPEPQPDVPPAAVQILALLQREGRLIDFLQEDLSQADDAQIGAVVRSTVYEPCRRALKEYMTLEPVMDGQEEERISVPAGFDPSQIRLSGKVEGEPPFQGTLHHKGWKLTAVKLPNSPEGCDPQVICPAEVEI